MSAMFEEGCQFNEEFAIDVGAVYRTTISPILEYIPYQRISRLLKLRRPHIRAKTFNKHEPFRRIEIL